MDTERTGFRDFIAALERHIDSASILARHWEGRLPESVKVATISWRLNLAEAETVEAEASS